MKDLAIAVIVMAIKDAVSTSNTIENTKIRTEAIEFLTEDNEDFKFWCDVAEINYNKFFTYLQDIKINKNKYLQMIKEYEI